MGKTNMLHRTLKVVGKLKALATKEQLCEPVHSQRLGRLQEILQ